MKRIAAFVAAIVFSTVGLVFAMSEGGPGGKWPASWPKELEPLRKQAWTWHHDSAGMSYEIPFANREEFEAAWPHILKLKTKGAPILLVRGPHIQVKEPKNAGVCVKVGPGSVPAKLVASESLSNGSTPASTNVEAVPSTERRDSAATPTAPAAEPAPAIPTKTPAAANEPVTWLMLVVDGEIVDLNRIPLPADTPIVDDRFKIGPNKPPAPAGEKFSSAAARELFRASGGDPDRFVRLPFPHGIPLKATQEVLDQDDLPKLTAMLKDTAKSDTWNTVAYVIGQIGNDADAAGALVDFAQRPIDWGSIDNKSAIDHVIAKANIIRWLGRMKYPARDETLLRAFSAEGANELVKRWIDDPALPEWARKNKDGVLGIVRGSAAIGLVLTGNKQHAATVEKAYRETAAQPATPVNEELYNQLVDAMAIQELIKAKGFDTFANLSGTPEWRAAIRPYIELFNNRGPAAAK